MMDRQRRCFVISPIGQEGSPVREHADDVFDFIIKPAMDECGIEAVRSDQISEPGEISDHMFREILSDDLCIAVLTYFNPNVFYELAIAQAAGRPVIMLLQKGKDLPFDIKDIKCITYELKPRPLFERVYVDQIIEFVKSLDAKNWEVRGPLDEYFRMYRVPKDKQIRFLQRAEEFGGNKEWLSLLEDTRDVFAVTSHCPSGEKPPCVSRSLT